MKKHVLFLCTGNLCRSPLAEGILKHKLAERKIDSVTVSSAGTFALNGRPAAELAERVAAERGVDISGHRVSHVTCEMLERADLVIGQRPTLSSKTPRASTACCPTSGLLTCAAATSQTHTARRSITLSPHSTVSRNAWKACLTPFSNNRVPTRLPARL